MKVVLGVLAGLVLAGMWYVTLHFANLSERAELAKARAEKASAEAERRSELAKELRAQATAAMETARRDETLARGEEAVAETARKAAEHRLAETRTALEAERDRREGLQGALAREEGRTQALQVRLGEVLRRVTRLEDGLGRAERDHRAAAALSDHRGQELAALARRTQAAIALEEAATRDRKAAEARARRAEELRQQMAAARDRSLAEASAARREAARAEAARRTAVSDRDAARAERDAALAERQGLRDAAARSAQRLRVARGEAEKAFNLMNLAEARARRHRAAREAAEKAAAEAAEQAGLARAEARTARAGQEAAETAAAAADRTRREALRTATLAKEEKTAALQEREEISARLVEARAQTKRIEALREETVSRMKALEAAGTAAQKERAMLQSELERQKQAAEAAARRAAEALKKLEGSEAQRKEVERKLESAGEEQRRTHASFLRLAHARRAEQLLEESEALWPAVPAKAAALARWLEQARELLEHRAAHRQRLREIREQARPWSKDEQARDRARNRAEAPELVKRIEQDGAEVARLEKAGNAAKLAEAKARLERGRRRLTRRRTWVFEDAALSYHAELLTGLMERCRRLERRLPEVERRLAFARSLEKRTIADPAAAWKAAAARVADPARAPAYGGLELAPQLGLIPLGPDPESGLEEFAHLASGTPPTRDRESGRLQLTADSAIVLVLLPGGGFRMGSSPPDDGGATDAPNLDPYGTTGESPVHAVTLAPFFLSKHEVTQAQWRRLATENPSTFGPGSRPGGHAITWLHPVEHLSWTEAGALLTRADLVLPTEAQWEYACRAGSTTVFAHGNAPAALAGAANVADEGSRAWFPATWSYEPGLVDGHGVHAPVGSFKPNAFGLHDLHGNVAEWCRDALADYTAPVEPGTGLRRSSSDALRVHRGGSYARPAIDARSAARAANAPDYRFSDLGLRAARALR